LSLKLAARFVIVDSINIADLQENDIAAHILDVSSVVPPGTIALLLLAQRVSGTGAFYAYPKSHATELFYISALQSGGPTLVPITGRELKWRNTIANDDWNLFLYGYFVQKRTR